MGVSKVSNSCLEQRVRQRNHVLKLLKNMSIGWKQALLVGLPILALFILALRRNPPSASVALAAAAVGTLVVLLASVPGPWPETLRPGIWSAALGTTVTLAVAAIGVAVGRRRERN